MADNVTIDNGALTDYNVATDKVTYSGDADREVQLMRPVLVTGAEGSKTVIDLPGDNTNGLDVDVTRLPALVAGTANIGDVDVLTVPTDPFGANADAASATGSISAKLRYLAATGLAGQTSLPAGTNNIGDVDIASMPAPHALPGVTMASFTTKYTTTQTSANMVAGTGGQRIYVTHLTISTGGTTAGEVGIYWGTGTLATAVTNNTVLFDGEFAPSATVRPGVVLSYAPYAVGSVSATGDNLRITTSAGITVYVVVHYYKA